MHARCCLDWARVRSFGRVIRWTLIGISICCASPANCRADSNSDGSTAGTPRIPTPVEDDADLHDVCFLERDSDNASGAALGWAAGDHGVIWHTDDGGRTWHLLPCPTQCALRSICFLSDRFGWVAGGATMPFTRTGTGILLATNDGGHTWTELAQGRLPQLHSIRFFTPLAGVAVGEAKAEFPTGVLTTRDGGKTWQPIEGPRYPGWRAADFASPESGIVTGLNGAVARIDGKIANVRGGGFGARGLYSVKLAGDTGWAVGDGALVLYSTSRGAAWQGAPGSLPDEAADIFNFRTIAVRGRKLWIAGSPGSAIWHSPDGGTTWTAARTGQTAPLDRFVFLTDQVGYAVGAFGSILGTEDGGETWRALRAGNRRAALLAIVARCNEISFRALTKDSADLGYRSVVLLPFRGNGEGEAAIDPDVDVRLHDAVTATGASRGEIGWRLPLEIPGLDQDAEKLIAHWMRRTEGRFRAAFYGSLVCQIRTWRPTAVLIEQPAPEDAAGNLLAGAVVEAVRQAADPSSFPAQEQLAGLSSWRASRVFSRLPAGSSGDFRIDGEELLPHLQSTVSAITITAATRLAPLDPDLPDADTFRMVYPPPSRGSRGVSAPADFFSGLAISPDSDARRRLSVIRSEFDESARQPVERNRNLRAIIRRQIAEPTGGAELLGMLRSSLQGTDKATASLQLKLLADTYRKHAEWDLVEATLAELVDRYPNEPATAAAMQWLLQSWTSAELTYQRFRNVLVQEQRTQYDPTEIGRTIEKALQLARTDPKERRPIETLPAPDPRKAITQTGRLETSQGNWLDVRLRQQRMFALQMAMLIRKKSPALFGSPEIQLPLAALLRQTGLQALPDEKRGRSATGAAQASASSAAPALIFDHGTQKAVKCKLTDRPPRLDGLLSDECWQQAETILLSAEGTPVDENAQAFVQIAYDAGYLYFAMAVPRVAGLPQDGAVRLGRKHDQDLSRYDRIALYLDVDRDFVTWYTIEIDQRGCVAESCCGDSGWNPKLYVAADTSEPDKWRIEGAIPWRELAPRAPQPGESWGLAVIRTIPAVRLESWAHPAARTPRPETFGLIHFQ